MITKLDKVLLRQSITNAVNFTRGILRQYDQAWTVEFGYTAGSGVRVCMYANGDKHHSLEHYCGDSTHPRRKDLIYLERLDTGKLEQFDATVWLQNVLDKQRLMTSLNKPLTQKT